MVLRLGLIFIEGQNCEKGTRGAFDGCTKGLEADQVQGSRQNRACVWRLGVDGRSSRPYDRYRAGEGQDRPDESGLQHVTSDAIPCQ